MPEFVLPYLSHVKESQRVARVAGVGPAQLTGEEELHVPELSSALRKKENKYQYL